MHPDRRAFLAKAAWLAATAAFIEHLPSPTARAAQAPALPTTRPTRTTSDNNAWSIAGGSNFRAIYGDPVLRNAFLLFLTNVYHLYPEAEFHAAISEAAR